MDLEQHYEEYKHIYKFGVLSPTSDYQLVMGIEHFSQTAGIPPHYVYRSIVDFAENGVTDWMRDYFSHKDNGIFGCCLVGDQDVLMKMSAMIGCAIRNYIDARLMTLQEVIDFRKNGSRIGFELVAVPNFFVSKSEGGDVPKWQSSQLLSWLYERYAEGVMTILYVSSMPTLKNSYGTAFERFITDNYKVMV